MALNASCSVEGSPQVRLRQAGVGGYRTAQELELQTPTQQDRDFDVSLCCAESRFVGEHDIPPRREGVEQERKIDEA